MSTIKATVDHTQAAMRAWNTAQYADKLGTELWSSVAQAVLDVHPPVNTVTDPGWRWVELAEVATHMRLALDAEQPMTVVVAAGRDLVRALDSYRDALIDSLDRAEASVAGR